MAMTLNAPTSTYTIESLPPEDFPAAIEMLSRGMRDNPLHVAAFGPDPDTRQRKLAQLFGMLGRNPNLVANAQAARDPNGTIVGVFSYADPGLCQPRGMAKLLMGPALMTLGIGNGRRVGSWLSAWSTHDLRERHCHFGPIGVDAHLQGQGIGSQMMRSFCEQMDAAGEHAYLETDKHINVAFYQRFGFEVVGEDEVIGVRNWFMVRKPAI